ncbi:serine/threonine-protein kinase [Streptomyces sp. CRN 30]|uniref:serine/threonine-protein kinase n=1 Tax=Streptomyces sp. CRN 30 TaxID=3075613 RepID=UPI002A81E013|nr:serine/threonine-protein kinase [Streptomyces sp. CRN 30]
MFEEPGGERVIAGRYRLLSPLGEGGMGTVWQARDEVLRREVAVKEVRAPAGLPAADVTRMYTRLEREAWAAARVTHPNVVTVYDVATDDGRPWIVMELVRGLSMADVLDAEGSMDPRRAAGIGAEVLAALRAAHAAGVLHRDVKPGNVLLADDGRVVLTDFGIAVVEGSSALTMTGEVIGSPEFLAPERALGRTPGPESDLWSLGVLLYAAVEGFSPFRQNTPLSTLRAIVDEELPPPRRAGPLAPVIEGLLRKDPAERLSAERAQQDLRVIAAGGLPGTATVPVPPYAPTVAEPAGFGAPTAGTPAAGATATAGTPDRNRRAAVALAAGLAVLLLALAGLAYALLGRDGDDDGKDGTAGGGARTSTSAPQSEDTGGEPTRTGGGGGGGNDDDGDGNGGGGEESSPQPEQSVEVSVAGSRTEYAGSCPPDRGEAPAFTATFRVERLPAKVVYRWVTPDGVLSGQDWRTLSFPADGGREQQDSVVVTTYEESGTVESELGVEVKDPVDATSNSVPFSVTCEGETPTDGTSPSSSTSPYSP